MLKHIASAQSEFSRELTNKEVRKLVKKQTGLDVRRMDNFSLVAIDAVHKLVHSHRLDGRVGLYSAATYFSVDLLHGLLQGIEAGEDMRPVDFISTVGNTANYYVAKLFDVTGPNVFIGAGEHAIQKLEMLARCDINLQQIDYALTLHWLDNRNCYQCEAKLLEFA